MDFELERMAIMGLALAAGALVKGATGMGLPLIALPVLATFFGLHHAVGIMAITQIVTNGMQIWQFRAARREDSMNFLPLFLATGAVGVVLGTWLLRNLPERVLIFSLGVLLLAYFGLKVSRPHLAVSAAMARRAGPAAGFGSGVLQGATGISAPVGVTFIHAMGLDRAAHVYAVSAMFLTLGLVQLPSLIVGGIMQPQWVIEALLAMIPILIFMPVGQALAGKLSRRAFDLMILIFLGLMGLKMVLGI
ncbi:sulfite exporter TauE/SafE family protein [Devosia sp. YIM 151766]|uniref:sulfite exporter TauE/SafE family protein n=1 Tax=Devosia sp. YIM 151766 TaxID=3017325 RepID=UPI00255C9F79|nr:sulfite exporter TauE/SafE family protein [Devosia sp. YIM 151766]WIY53067.1 sulfite exporter TauE/SafE family protein [Devosia sp. YIM 151766]